ncbi:hypothetical protein [uncultured Draconibacterium sp.]|uniref:hypothetical protein n=1 Tax=uncultured Draconibacterium sp. TaxID=1573823 RepID=UPI0032167209
MPHKEHYRVNLPHYQQSGQAYFITWCLKDAVPAHALKRYTDELKNLKLQINGCGGFKSAAGKVVTLSDRQAGESSNFTADWNRQDPGSSDSGKADSLPEGQAGNPLLNTADQSRQHVGASDSDANMLRIGVRST